MRKSNANARWWIIAASAALLITALVFAVVYLVTKKPSVVDQLVILTIPSGAEVTLNGVSYGTSPVKLEQVKVGTYRLTISKENYETINTEVTISDETPLDFKLTTKLSPDLAGKSREEQIKEFQKRADDYFARGRYANAGDESAMRYVNMILDYDSENTYAKGKREEIRKVLLQNAQSEMNRGALGSAKEYYNQLRAYFPEDETARAGANRLETLLSSKRGEVSDLIRKAEAALRAGKLVEPWRSSAFYYAREVLAIDNQNEPAQAVMNQIRERLLAVANQHRARNDVNAEIRQLQILNQYFHDDAIRERLNNLTASLPVETVRASDPDYRRQQGLNKFARGDYAGAVEDLEFVLAILGANTEVLFALGSSHKELGHYEKAMSYLEGIKPVTGEQYISSRGLMGDIERRTNLRRALDYYEEARARGGSTLYSLDRLNDKIESVQRELRERAEAPSPVLISVKHSHTFGSCKGILKVDATGIFYTSTDKKDDNVAYTLLGVNPILEKNKIKLAGKTFEGTPGELERFRDAVNKYQQAAAKK